MIPPLASRDIKSAARMRALSLEARFNQPENFITPYEDELAKPLQTYLDAVQNGWLFVAGEDDGMIFLGPNGRVNMVYVRPASRGHGLGDKLVSAVVETAVMQGMERLSLGVFEENHHAVALYRRHGFDITKRAPYGTRTDCVMERVF